MNHEGIICSPAVTYHKPIKFPVFPKDAYVRFNAMVKRSMRFTDQLSESQAEMAVTDALAKFILDGTLD